MLPGEDKRGDVSSRTRTSEKISYTCLRNIGGLLRALECIEMSWAIASFGFKAESLFSMQGPNTGHGFHTGAITVSLDV